MKSFRKTGAMIPMAALLIGAGLAIGIAPQAQAQAAPFLDTPTNHWAYEAVQDLAKKGIVIGYPDGTYGGKRPMTRYEFAVALDRALRTVADMVAAQQPGAPPAPAGTPAPGTVTQDDLNRLQALIDKFRPELDTIQTNLKQAQDDIEALRADVLDAKALANKAQATADNSYGVGATRKFAISGYIQARFQQVPSGQGSQQRFQQGTPSSAGAYNGNYAQTGNQDSFEVRRARLKFTGQITPNSKYAIQIDTDGAVSNATTPQVTVREAYGSYTFGNGDIAKNLTLTAGQFATPFGYALPTSMANELTPERPLAFNEGGVGIFNTQDYDKGVQFGYNTNRQLLFVPSGLKLTVALINGNGRSSEGSDRYVDQIYRVAYQTSDKVFSLGGSYYEGQIKTPGAGVAGNNVLTGTGYLYTGLKKELYGADTQIALPFGPFLNAEYIGGRYEQRTYFTGGTSPFANDTSLTTVNAPGNHIDGYYAQGGWTFGQTGNHPLTLAAQYDVLRRGEGRNSNSAYTDKNLGYGALYNLDKATRLRVWYTHPDAVAHNPAAPAPPKYGLLIGEMQVKF